jgi:hypothetical protein
MEESSQSEKYSSTGIYVLVSGLLVAIATACFYFLEKPLHSFGLAAIPLLLIITSKNTVIELFDQHFLIKNYFLLIGVKKRQYAYCDIVFVHYHRHSHFFLSGFDFWGFYHIKPVEVRFKNTQFEALPVYGARATLLKGIQAVNDRIQEREGHLHEQDSNKVS